MPQEYRRVRDGDSRPEARPRFVLLGYLAGAAIEMGSSGPWHLLGAEAGNVVKLYA
jgi:hypothetical protein